MPNRIPEPPMPEKLRHYSSDTREDTKKALDTLITESLEKAHRLNKNKKLRVKSAASRQYVRHLTRLSASTSLRKRLLGYFPLPNCGVI